MSVGVAEESVKLVGSNLFVHLAVILLPIMLVLLAESCLYFLAFGSVCDHKLTSVACLSVLQSQFVYNYLLAFIWKTKSLPVDVLVISVPNYFATW
jgi:hypothetical protein